MNFKRRSAFVHATRFDGNAVDAPAGVCYCSRAPAMIKNQIPQAHIHAPNRAAKVVAGDWIVRDEHDAMFVCGDKVFHERYEPA